MSNELIDLFKTVDLQKISYNKIRWLLYKNKVQLPNLTTLIKKGNIIQRGRLNDCDAFYNSEQEISYRTDYGNIKEFGRANRPFSSRFYGALPSTDIGIPRITLYCELVEDFHNEPGPDCVYDMTVGQWEVESDIEVADVFYSDKFNTNQNIVNKREKWIQKLNNEGFKQKDIFNYLNFFSDEFSKKNISHHFDYKFSAAFSDIAIEGNKLDGVLYPSVKSDYLGNNIVLSEATVEKKLNLINAAMFRFEKKNNQTNLFPIYVAESLGPLNTFFKWIKYKK